MFDNISKDELINNLKQLITKTGHELEDLCNAQNKSYPFVILDWHLEINELWKTEFSLIFDSDGIPKASIKIASRAISFLASMVVHGSKKPINNDISSSVRTCVTLSVPWNKGTRPIGSSNRLVLPTNSSRMHAQSGFMEQVQAMFSIVGSRHLTYLQLSCLPKNTYIIYGTGTTRQCHTGYICGPAASGDGILIQDTPDTSQYIFTESRMEGGCWIRIDMAACNRSR